MTPEARKQFDLFPNPSPAPDWKSQKRAGMKQAEEHASAEWIEGSTRLLRELCVSRPSFMAWELTSMMRDRGLETPSDRAMGPVIMRAAKSGWIRKSSEYRPNPLAHGCPSPVWISNLYEYGVRG